MRLSGSVTFAVVVAAAFAMASRAFPLLLPCRGFLALPRLKLALLLGQGFRRLLFQTGLAGLQASPPTVPIPQALRQFIAPPLGPIQAVFGFIRRLRLAQHRLHGCGDRLHRAIRCQGRIGFDLGPIQGHDPHLDHPRLGTQSQHIGEQRG